MNDKEQLDALWSSFRALKDSYEQLAGQFIEGQNALDAVQEENEKLRASITALRDNVYDGQFAKSEDIQAAFENLQTNIQAIASETTSVRDELKEHCTRFNNYAGEIHSKFDHCITKETLDGVVDQIRSDWGAGAQVLREKVDSLSETVQDVKEIGAKLPKRMLIDRKGDLLYTTADGETLNIGPVGRKRRRKRSRRTAF